MARVVVSGAVVTTATEEVLTLGAVGLVVAISSWVVEEAPVAVVVAKKDVEMLWVVAPLELVVGGASTCEVVAAWVAAEVTPLGVVTPMVLVVNEAFGGVVAPGWVVVLVDIVTPGWVLVLVVDEAFSDVVAPG